MGDVDKGGMYGILAQFPKQIERAIKLGKKVEFDEEIDKIVVAGMGGSGIGGELLKNYLDLKIPVFVNKGYGLPNFVNSRTLVFVISYSGNTEETLQAFDKAESKGAKIVCISSGGKVIEKAQAKGYDHILIPGGNPPRACLGYSLTQQLFVLHMIGLISEIPLNELRKIPAFLDEHENDIQNQARKVAKKIYDKMPIIYINANMESVAVRLRQQLNENSKILCWHHVIPEMNHNELVGWRKEDENLAVIIFRNENDFEKIQQRIEINKKIFKKYTSNILELYSIGNNHIERSMYLVHLSDWISLFIAGLKEMDAVEVNVIDYLKAELKKSF